MSRLRRVAGAAVVATLCAIHPATQSHAQTQAQPPVGALITDAVVADLRKAMTSPVAVLLVRAQNARHKGLSQERIDALDKQWRAELKSEAQPLVAQLYGNPLSAHLTRLQADSDGLYTEIFVMDSVGLNVGQSAVTSDYWQGDEGKWQKTFQVGPDAVFIDDPEMHEGTKTWRVQVNLSIADPDTGAAIGAATVEVNLSELARRQGASL
ncbi:hypothetical protein ACM64Y_10525 [Novispirillum sp. DQ9]|uniref:hypothetical protein n=1 Tax=Novispirillum sp. DQ9 TaxID=3398612 RepID=UPI003C7A893C